MNIYVGNLDYKVNEKDIESVFEEYGTVNSVKIIMDKFNGKSKGFGFVTMDSDAEANKAIKELHGLKLKNRSLVINEAKPKE